MILRVKGLYKGFKGVPVLEDVSFGLRSGEILAVIGRSGTGKTTLLRCINNLEKCDRGTIEVDNDYLCKDDGKKSVYPKPAEMLPLRKKLGLVFQNFNLFPHMSVMENIIEAPIRVFGIPRKEAAEKARELLVRLDIEDKENSYPFELSGGQRQRLAIARACALNPMVMCLDEPTSALDPELREGIAKIAEDLARQGMGVLVITHDMAFAKRVADRVIFMEEGRIVEEGSKTEFFGNVENERVRRFVTL